MTQEAIVYKLASEDWKKAEFLQQNEVQWELHVYSDSTAVTKELTKVANYTARQNCLWENHKQSCRRQQLSTLPVKAPGIVVEKFLAVFTGTPLSAFCILFIICSIYNT